LVNILIVGSGGREHALAWAFSRDNPSARLFCAPGNPGTADLATNLPLRADDIDGLVSAARDNAIDLTMVGPEVPLALGLADRLRADGRLVFGPSASAARIEASKAFAKEIMRRAKVPTATSRTFAKMDEALSYVDRHAEPLVVKASGLAGGKGAVVCATRREASRAVRAIMEDRSLGDAGTELVIEDFMEGEELSVFALTNGLEFVLLPAAQDHKRLLDGDKGPNTGGMGAYTPVSLATPALLDRIEQQILIPTLGQMAREGSPFTGLLYVGLMIAENGSARVVEFNCRFGDPETQAVLPILAPGLLHSIEQVARGETPSPIPALPGSFAVTTVLAARGYPDRPEKGAEVGIPKQLPDNVLVFQAGTARDTEGTLRVAGGRVLSVTGVGHSFAAARKNSRSGAEAIVFESRLYRSDIGWREEQRME
jgi:phosphoribosylamine--glycine ligase